MTTADGNDLKVFGETFLELTNRKLRRSFRWNFVVAAVTKPILGTDFLAQFDLHVDCKNQKLIDGTTGVSAITHISECDPTQVTPILKMDGSVSLEIQELLSKHPQLFKPTKVNSQAGRNYGQVTSHHISTNSDIPVFAKLLAARPDKLEVAKKEFKDLLANGIIRPSNSRPSNSPWASPLHMVKKEGTNSRRPCGDYRHLNSITVADRYPVPHIHSFSHKLYLCTHFSKIDLKKAYYHVPVTQKGIEKTAVTTPFGLFEFLKMHFGLRNTAQSFQRYMNNMS